MPETAPDPTAPLIGARIRDLRKRQKLTLADLAAATDLSVGYISQIERDLAFPSITALVGIAKSLGVNVQWFFAGSTTEPPEEKGYVVRRANRMRLSYDQGIVDELLTPKMSPQIEMIHTLLPPGAESSKSYSHEGEEVGLVLEGQVDFWVGERHFTLNAGDSISYASHEPHRYRNTGTTAAVVIWAISPPSF